MTFRRSAHLTLAGAALGLAAVTAAPRAALACPSDPFMGSLCMIAGSFCPDQFAEANGQLLPIAQYTALYSLLGTTYGGDGRTTFALPNMQGRSPVGIGRGQGLTTVSPGQWRGQETVQPSTATLATHTHPIVVSGGGTLSGTIDVVPGAATGTTEPQAGTSYHLGGVGGRAEGGPYTTNSPGGSPATVEGVSVELGNGIQAGPAGAGNNETNIPPQIGIRFCIALDGIYPPRPN